VTTRFDLSKGKDVKTKTSKMAICSELEGWVLFNAPTGAHYL